MLGCVKCLLGCFIPIGFPAGKFEQQDGPAPDYAQEKCWDCYGADNGPSALVPEGVGDKLPVDQRPADVFFIHPTGYFGAAWQMPPSDLPTGELTGLSMSRNASAFNSTCRIFAPRYRQATLSSFLDVDVPSAREAMDGAYADVRAAFQHYMDVQNRGRPFVIASHSQGGWHAMRLLQEFVEAKPLAEKFVAAYCLGSWLPEAMFLGKGAAFKQVHLSGGPEDLCCVAVSPTPCTLHPTPAAGSQKGEP
ncbi:hypothetical protein T484DRAFT_3440094 [Baffinella frigidus]|nr:hypothetical protein T484DRAFT_3440094 [Cryptophyta sp. CCMP2293]